MQEHKNYVPSTIKKFWHTVRGFWLQCHKEEIINDNSITINIYYDYYSISININVFMNDNKVEYKLFVGKKNKFKKV